MNLECYRDEDGYLIAMYNGEYNSLAAMLTVDIQASVKTCDELLLVLKIYQKSGDKQVEFEGNAYDIIIKDEEVSIVYHISDDIPSEEYRLEEFIEIIETFKKAIGTEHI